MEINRLQNVLITGLPRSGTNLTCRLLNQIEDVLALQEPMDVGSLGDMDSFMKVKNVIDKFIADIRKSAIERGEVYTKHVDGKIGDNYFQSPDEASGIRKNLVEQGFIHLDRKLTPNMTVAIKHNAAFTALLPELTSCYPVFALIRNPLWTLASWNSNNLPVYNGHVPMAERIDRKLASDLENIPDRIDRQIHILGWMFNRYSNLEQKHVIRYEDMIESGGSCLEVLIPEAKFLNERLLDQNRPERYPYAPVNELRRRLLAKGGSFLAFYPRHLLE